MLSEFLLDRAALYASGAMPAAERESFEVLIESDPALREQVAALQESLATAVLSTVAMVAAVPTSLRTRVLAAVEDCPQESQRDALVVTDAEGRVQWLNDAFTDLCGYSLAELKGRKPGHVLQGPETDPATVEEIRASIRRRRACRVQMVNYHKDGTRYRADVRISPIADDAGAPVFFVARERKLEFADA